MIAEAFETLRLVIIAGGAWFIAGAIAVGLVLAVFLVALHAAARTVWRALRPSAARSTTDYEEVA
ncbi:hypothetical protein [Streptomyces sp. NRRL F-5650]|uniref:hypothetical protein n=1 Tax=Streptomyces sp. NRRL F-5650 TaxID=1463868 RepID=UPI0004CAF551|nr:hypothetical protein [Streptomyces sp. NRRL F-5650]